MAEPKQFTFERKLSIDGVAIIAGVVASLLYIGSLKERINNLTDASDQHTRQLVDLGTSVASVKGDVAVLSAVVNERTALKH